MPIQRFVRFSISKFAAEERPYEKAATITRYLYYLLAATSFATLNTINVYLSKEEVFSPIWTIRWSRYFGYHSTVIMVVLLFTFCSLAGAFFWQYRAARLAAFFGTLQIHAFLSSFSEADHQMYPWLYILFLFLLLGGLFFELAADELDLRHFRRVPLAEPEP